MKKIVIAAVAILVIIVGITAYMNRGDLAAKQDSQDNAILIIKSDGAEVARVDMEYIKTLGEVEFDANIKSSGQDPEKHSFAGVPLKNVFDSQNIPTEGKTMVIVKAVDGYTSALNMDEVLEDDNVYLAYKRDGEPLGRKEDGGSGPYQVIIRKDPFSQRWCKFVMEIELQ
ncbi:MAG: hypothetical protein HPY66_2334 [Firmicutes bacterium]|nr:hypothetical protein [Bacillota bacterium]MDI6705723.1 molybdopterin-dependent oxidoreductase [Bacillota bacterium]